VTLLKPLYGAEPGLESDLATFCRQDYPAPVQIVFGVQNPSDPARAVAERVRHRFPDCDIEIVVDRNVYGSNRKIANAINMARVAKHDVLILADSDIAVAPDYLRIVAAVLDAPGVGLVTCLYRGRYSGTLWSRVSALGISARFLPDAILGFRLGLATPCFGSTLALRRSTLDEIGGFGAFADVLADDYEVGRSVRASGYRVEVPPMVVTHRCTERGFRELVRHETRWARTIRAIDPVGYAGSVLTHPVPLALAGVCLAGFSVSAFAVLGGALLARGWLLSRADPVLASDPTAMLLLPGRDLLSFFIFLGAFLGRSVTWHGQRFDTRTRAVPTGEKPT
jgi:ceramide glucosyltransferase